VYVREGERESESENERERERDATSGFCVVSILIYYVIFESDKALKRK